MSEQSRFTDRDKAKKSDQLYETTEYSRRCLCDDMVELTFDNIKLNAMIKKSEEDFANLQNKLMCSLLLILGNDDDVDRIIEKTDELTRAFKDERVSTLQHENAKLRDALKALMVGTYAELCSDRDAPQCRKCSMRRDECECAITEAMELLGLNTDGTPVGAEVDG
jgi:hypothetical protein